MTGEPNLEISATSQRTRAIRALTEDRQERTR